MKHTRFHFHFLLSDDLIFVLQPEMEMVASGLKKTLGIEQRKHLLALFREVCGSNCQKISEEALGLVSNFAQHPLTHFDFSLVIPCPCQTSLLSCDMKFYCIENVS